MQCHNYMANRATPFTLAGNPQSAPSTPLCCTGRPPLRLAAQQPPALPSAAAPPLAGLPPRCCSCHLLQRPPGFAGSSSGSSLPLPPPPPCRCRRWCGRRWHPCCHCCRPAVRHLPAAPCKWGTGLLPAAASPSHRLPLRLLPPPLLPGRPASAAAVAAAAGWPRREAGCPPVPAARSMGKPRALKWCLLCWARCLRSPTGSTHRQPVWYVGARGGVHAAHRASLRTRQADPTLKARSSSRQPTWVVGLHACDECCGQRIDVLLVCRRRPRPSRPSQRCAVRQRQAPVGAHHPQLPSRHLAQRQEGGGQAAAVPAARGAGWLASRGLATGWQGGWRACYLSCGSIEDGSIREGSSARPAPSLTCHPPTAHRLPASSRSPWRQPPRCVQPARWRSRRVPGGRSPAPPRRAAAGGSAGAAPGPAALWGRAKMPAAPGAAAAAPPVARCQASCCRCRCHCYRRLVRRLLRPRQRPLPAAGSGSTHPHRCPRSMAPLPPPRWLPGLLAALGSGPGLLTRRCGSRAAQTTPGRGGGGVAGGGEARSERMDIGRLVGRRGDRPWPPHCVPKQTLCHFICPARTWPRAGRSVRGLRSWVRKCSRAAEAGPPEKASARRSPGRIRECMRTALRTCGQPGPGWEAGWVWARRSRVASPAAGPSRAGRLQPSGTALWRNSSSCSHAHAPWTAAARAGMGGRAARAREQPPVRCGAGTEGCWAKGGAPASSHACPTDSVQRPPTHTWPTHLSLLLAALHAGGTRRGRRRRRWQRVGAAAAPLVATLLLPAASIAGIALLLARRLLGHLGLCGGALHVGLAAGCLGVRDSGRLSL